MTKKDKPNQKSDLKFAQFPYKVKNKDVKEAAHNTNSLFGESKNPYDLIACGDYNTFAVISL